MKVQLKYNGTLLCHAMAQTVGYRLLAAEAQIQSVAQAVGFWLLTAQAQIKSHPLCLGFVVDRVEQAKVFV